MIDPTKLVRSAFLALALMLLAPLSGTGGVFFGVEAAQAATVSRIVVTGNSQVDDSTVIKYLAVGVGDNATSADLNASVDALLATGLFKTASVTMSGSTLNVRVTENGIAASVLFEGNQRFTDANLVAMVDTVNRGTVDENGLARDVRAITTAYQDVGFTNVKVTYRLEPVGDGRMRVVFQIEEGVRNGIAAINFTGNNSIGAAQLKSVIRTKESGWLSWLFRDDNYTEEQLQIDRELIRQYYANHGFPDAQVPSAVAEYSAERNGYFLSFTIIEGAPFQFGNVAVETSIAGLDANRLTGTIRTREGSRFSAETLARSTQDMAVEAANLGYPFADVRARIDRDPAGGVMGVTYLVDEGQRLYVERIDITGNEKTRDFVIRRELPFAEGDPFNRALVTRGKSNIESLGFFRRVNVNATQGSAPDKIILSINVEEQSTGDYGFMAGYDSSKGIIGEISLTERNFLGRGQYLKAAVGASPTGQTYDLSFTEPYFMGLKVSAGLDAYHRITDETDANVYGITSTGGQLRFGLPVTRDLQGSFLLGADYTQIIDADDDSEIFVAGNREFFKGWVGYGLTYNGLDNARKPTEGLYAQITQSYTGFDYNFLKTEARARYYMPVNADMNLIGSVRLQGGIINDFTGNVNALEAFTYGPTLVRGFAARGMGPKTAGGEILGYTAYAGASAELTMPVPGLPESYGLSAALFADAAIIDGQGVGTVAADSVDNPLKSSVGASVIWDSPFGPLRGDFAWVLSQATDDTTTKVCADDWCPAFALTMQTAF